jgi:integrase
VSDVEDLKPGQSITITEGKTGQENVLMINRTVFKAIKKYIEQIQPDDDFLFATRKTKKPLTIQAVNALLKKWTRAINLKGNCGARSLRKTLESIETPCSVKAKGKYLECCPLLRSHFVTLKISFHLYLAPT